jgi:hypothetical protein
MKLNDLGTASDELIAVAPNRIFGICQCDRDGIAGVPGILGRLNLLQRGLQFERRERWFCRTHLISNLIRRT